MERKTVSLTSLQYKALEPVLNKLVSKYSPINIICFGYVSEAATSANCFTGEMKNCQHYFYLVMITNDVTRIEHDIQNCANAHFDQGKIVILAHGYDTVKTAIHQGDRFFNQVCSDGLQLYSSTGLRLAFDYPNLNPATTANQAEQHYFNRIEIAKGFMNAGRRCMEQEQFANALFLFHQTVEQSCSAMIGVYLTYRSDVHNLYRLLDFCRCFSEEPSAIFPERHTEDRRLFELLLKSYSDARYKDNFQVNRQDSEAISLRVYQFLELADRLCRVRVAYLKSQVSDAGQASLTFSNSIT